MSIRVMKSIFECKMFVFINLFSKIHRAEHQRITFLRAPLKAEDVLQGRPQLLFMSARQALLR